MLQQLLEFVKRDNPPESLTEETEQFTLQERIENAHLRHLDDKESKLSNNTQAFIIKELGITVCVNSITTFIINQAVATMTNDFNLLLAGFCLIGTNSVVSLTTLGNRKTAKYFLPIASSRMLLSLSVNGQKLAQINTAYQTSIETYNKMNTQIEAFESGYKSPSNNNIISMVGIVVMVLVFFRLLFGAKKT